MKEIRKNCIVTANVMFIKDRLEYIPKINISLMSMITHQRKKYRDILDMYSDLTNGNKKPLSSNDVITTSSQE